MDRVKVYTGEVLFETDVLQTNLNAYNAVSRLAEAIFGPQTLLNGLVCQATAPASLAVDVLAGQIYSLEVTDATDYGVIPSSDIEILKQGILYETTTLATPAPGTIGNSINYLVQVAFSEVDGDSASRPFYQDSPQTVDQQRLDECVVAVKAGTMAPTGTQVTPSPDSGYEGAYVVAVAYGQTTVLSGNITIYGGAPFLTETLLDKISQATADGRYTQTSAVTIYAAGGDYYTDSGVANAYVLTTVGSKVAPAAYFDGMRVRFIPANVNTAASTVNVASLGVKNIKCVSSSLDVAPGQLPATHEVEIVYNVAAGVFYLARSFQSALTGIKGADIASATTTDLSLATGDFVDVTGTVTITGLGTATVGIVRTVRFTGILTLTYNATSLILPGAASIVTAANDTAVFRSLGAGNWICVSYQRVATAPLLAATQAQQETSTSNVVFVTPGVQQYHPSTTKAWVVFNGTGTVAILNSYNGSSITDNGVGDYTVNLSISFSSTFYAVSGGTTENSNADSIYFTSSGRTNSSMQITTARTTNGVKDDNSFICVKFSGDL